MHRFYQQPIINHFRAHRQMLFLMGPRQVGKTTLGLALKEDWDEVFYFSWDNVTDRDLITKGPQAIAEKCQLRKNRKRIPLIIFDEIHKYPEWKIFLKGLYDVYPSMARIAVMGSARLDVYQKGGDSLMGRYFLNRIHPLSVAEIAKGGVYCADIPTQPAEIDTQAFKHLLLYGGFPDPFVTASPQFFGRWKKMRYKQLFEEDLRELTRVHQLSMVEVLAEHLRRSIGQLTSYASMSRKLRVSDQSIRSWLAILKSIYYCYEVRPWSKNIARSLLKEPKYYLWDWSLCENEGQRAENMVASHLLKAVHFWTDEGLGEYDLYYLRDKQKREVDFVVTRDGKPYFLVEVKNGDNKGISRNLHYFADQIQPEHAFQVVLNKPYVNEDVFFTKEPLIVPAKTFLSQLV